ncbi:helix-turn-helix transcriptional regulator [Pararhizobium sp. A13]|uniref:helix-turn-helix domain-containing protein n=1 Tax=Pararhizobium sp. A13 TaxID=3133975 RepID=UPI00324A80C1
MNSAVSFKTPNGEELVLLSKQDYEDLVRQAELAEDLADAETVRDFREKLARGEEELIPLEIVSRLIDGENPIRVWREHRGLSAKKLAEMSGISAAYLSELETGKKDGSLSVFKSIATALRLDLDDLVRNETGNPAGHP